MVGPSEPEQCGRLPVKEHEDRCVPNWEAGAFRLIHRLFRGSSSRFTVGESTGQTKPST